MSAHRPPADLAEALAVIARQAEEIELLRTQHADARLAEDLRAALVRSALAGTIAAPVTHSRLLEMIVETAAQVISSQAASLFLVGVEPVENGSGRHRRSFAGACSKLYEVGKDIGILPGR